MIKDTRLRKAWMVTISCYDNFEIVYAPSAAKARSETWRTLSDGNIRLMDITVRRHSSADVHLPLPDPLADQLNDDERHCLLHAYGADCGNPYKAGYRDYFYTHRDDPPLVSLTKHDLMKPMDGDKWGENMTYFILTTKGKHVALSLVPEYKT